MNAAQSESLRTHCKYLMCARAWIFCAHCKMRFGLLSVFVAAVVAATAVFTFLFAIVVVVVIQLSTIGQFVFS